MAHDAQLFAAYEEWRENPGRLTKNAFIDACRGQNPQQVANWFESPFYLAALMECGK